MGKPKRHHYVPIFYLAGFTDATGLLHFYEKGRPGVRTAPPKHTAVAEHFYTADTRTHGRDSEIVESLMAKVDERAASILRKIKQDEQIDAQERADFASFMAMMILRVPHFRLLNQQMMEASYKKYLRFAAAHPGPMRAWMEAHAAETGLDLNDDIANDLFEMWRDGSYSLEFHPEDHMRLLVLANEWYSSLVVMRWTFLRAPKNRFFITSDNPLVYLDPVKSIRTGAGAGLRDPKVQVTFPLAKDLLLRAEWIGDDGKYVQAAASEVTEANRRTVQFASKFVYAAYHSQPLDRMVQRHIGSAPRYEFETVLDPKDGGLLMHTRPVHGSPRTRSFAERGSL